MRAPLPRFELFSSRTARIGGCLFFVWLASASADWSAQLRGSDADPFARAGGTRVVFAGSTISLDFDFRGSADGALRLYADLFQTSTQTAAPLFSAQPVSPPFQLVPRKPQIAHCEIVLPKTLNRGRALARIYAATTPIALIRFEIVSDDILKRLAKQPICVTEAEPVRQAFVDRELRIRSSTGEDLDSDWRGLWFIDRSKCAELRLPRQLRDEQRLILLENDEKAPVFPLAKQSGSGWVLRFPVSFFDNFQNNAGIQTLLEALIQETQQPQ